MYMYNCSTHHIVLDNENKIFGWYFFFADYKSTPLFGIEHSSIDVFVLGSAPEEWNLCNCDSMSVRQSPEPRTLESKQWMIHEIKQYLNPLFMIVVSH